MHQRVIEKFGILMDYHGKQTADTMSVLDVGSLDMNGTLRPIVESRGWSYTGLDLVPGANVDIVATDPYSYDLQQQYDLVISNATVEHVARPWLWICALKEAAKIGGRVIVMCPWNMTPHGSPRDYWRILPDGIDSLFTWAGLMTIECDRDDVYSWGVGVRQ